MASGDHITGHEQIENYRHSIGRSGADLSNERTISIDGVSERMIVFAVQSDLFAGPSLAGLTQAEGIVTQNEEQALIAFIDAVKLSPFHFHIWLGKRLTASFGWNYHSDTARLAPKTHVQRF